MHAEIIAIGSELLLGQIVNTNAKYLSNELADIGISVFHHTVVGDNKDRLKNAIEIAESRASLILFTGGLGPTKDDLTKETIADHLGVELEYNEEAMERIQGYYQKVNKTMSENNRKQALILQQSRVLPNDFGMAPGMFYKGKNHQYMLLPGPPRELEPMFNLYARPILMAETNEKQVIKSRVLRFFGIGESQLETDIMDIIDTQTNPTVAPLADDGEVTLRLTAKHTNVIEADKLLQGIEARITERVGEYLYGYNDTSLMNEVVHFLKKQGKTIATAESLTGGMFSSALTSYAGISASFLGGIVCYSNDAKQNFLDVSTETLSSKGAVSGECAAELAGNIRNKMNSDLGISFTGVAGPNSSEGKEVGTVYIGLAIKGQKTNVYSLQLAGNRESIRMRAVKYGCYYLLKQLQK
ncbi:competence/damage-inducible protein A [Bacillus sp. 2205SS5-2]|uniref:competence/damage-inducible protein A n=1 Tax=Bacillus sp. 2205SS5-2 TaxID=3109031 RepID=UPI0030076413